MNNDDLFRNGDKILQEIEAKLDYTPKVLLQCCCAPCSSYCIKELTNYFDLYLLYYNPNISPVEEYTKRKNELIRFVNEFPHKNKIEIIDCDYDGEEFFDMAKGMEMLKEGGERCFKCYNLRLEKAAQMAKEMGMDYFCTTLTLSPLKSSYIINKIGNDLQNKYQVKYLFSDFKKRNGYLESIKLSKEYNLYRQDYCGCIYSKRDRDLKKREKEEQLEIAS